MEGKQIGPWVLLDKVGEGAFGSVYLCHHKDNKDDIWAIKLVPFVEFSKKNNTDTLQNCSLLCWENTIYTTYIKKQKYFPSRPTKDYYSNNTDGWRYITLQYMNGGTLKDRVLHGSMSPKTIYSVVLRILCALEFLHSKRFVYIDLKCENIMIHNNDVYLVDMGAVKKFTNYNGTFLEHGKGEGNDYFMSIRAHDKEYPHPADDLESLGYVLLYMLSGGNIPWNDANSPEEIVETKISSRKDSNKKYKAFGDYMFEVDSIDITQLKVDYEPIKNILIDAGGTLDGEIEF